MAKIERKGPQCKNRRREERRKGAQIKVSKGKPNTGFPQIPS